MSAKEFSLKNFQLQCLTVTSSVQSLLILNDDLRDMIKHFDFSVGLGEYPHVVLKFFISPDSAIDVASDIISDTVMNILPFTVSRNDFAATSECSAFTSLTFAAYVE